METKAIHATELAAHSRSRPRLKFTLLLDEGGLRANRPGAKVYAVRYRLGSGRNAPMRRVTIGKHGSPWTPDQARAEAKRLSGLVAHGKDPAGAKAAAKAAVIIRIVKRRIGSVDAM
jgi:hypothetical protein